MSAPWAWPLNKTLTNLWYDAIEDWLTPQCFLLGA
jgi:hypothetical protein